MVTTRNRSRNPALVTQEATDLPPPARPRRTRQTKPKPAIVKDAEESETVESSSPTSSPDSRSPLSSPEEPLSPAVEFAKKSRVEVVPELEPEQEAVEEQKEQSEEEAQTVPDEDEQQLDSDSESESESEDDDDEDLDALLVKAQASLKRKAMFDEKDTEPKFNFPKLQTGLKDKSMYIKQENGRAKVDVATVIVVDKGNKSAANKSALETCEVNMNSDKVHVSKRQKQEEREKTTGKKWFDMPQQVLTPELKRDLQILKLRNVLDPKRFYKREDKSKARFPKYFQVGTIIEGNTEFYSSRLSKKERATTITGEVMKDIAGRDYYKRKFDEIQVAKQSGGKKFYKKGNGKQSKSWRK
ncbi:hypothetical protein BGX29_007261 [Mortierella sp. GBA35]|nr:hypothetical protein BGX23_010060 [Mortierella sp. AD031]KAF9099184.1 hypothetical protein BGX29_007261 [Mortierella sp. GBA35]